MRLSNNRALTDFTREGFSQLVINKVTNWGWLFAGLVNTKTGFGRKFTRCLDLLSESCSENSPIFDVTVTKQDERRLRFGIRLG